MVESAKELLGRALRNWGRFVGGPATGTIGLAAAMFGWNIKPWVWMALSVCFFLLGMIQAYHHLRLECDAAMEGVREIRDTQATADRLTKHHDHGVHELMHRSPPWPTIQNDFEAFWNAWPAWVQQVWTWNESVRADMERLGCSRSEISHFATIPDPHPIQTGLTSPRRIRKAEWDSIVKMHATRITALKEIARSYETRAVAAKSRPIPPTV